MSLLFYFTRGEKPAVMDMLNNLKKLNASYFDSNIAIDGQIVGNQNSDQYTWKHNWYFFGNNLRMDCLDWSNTISPDLRRNQFCSSLTSDFSQVNVECGPLSTGFPFNAMRFICKRNTGSVG
jgi:hypothetical protein